MAWRLDRSIIRGELDNTVRGRVQARLEVMGMDEPLLLHLAGNAWRDLAGSRLCFVNPEPILDPEELFPSIEPLCTGWVGDMTASRKVEVLLADSDEIVRAHEKGTFHELPSEWRSLLYLEWFSPTFGRVVIEGCHFELEVMEHAWEMDEDEEAAQKMANMHTMREYLADIIQRPENPATLGSEKKGSTPISEDEWEEQFKASDRMTDASMEAEEKYQHDDDRREKVAYVMGWDDLMDVMAHEESAVKSFSEIIDPEEDGEWVYDEDTDLLFDEDMTEEQKAMLEKEESEADWELTGLLTGFLEKKYPLLRFGREFLNQVSDDLDALDSKSQLFYLDLEPLDHFHSSLSQVLGKLHGSLIYLDETQQGEKQVYSGFMLAVTKRCLNWCNEALTALSDLQDCPEMLEEQEMLDRWQDGIFKLRDGVTDLRAEWRQKAR